MNSGQERVERRLAAILAADVAGYSRPMGTDEEGTLAALKAIRRELGEQQVNNIARPVRGYRIPIAENAAAIVPLPLPEKPSARRLREHHCLNETKVSVANKLSRGTFSAAFSWPR
jgi:class 3 adenylate cyclase